MTLRKRGNICTRTPDRVVPSTACSKEITETLIPHDRILFNVRSKADISQLNLPHGTDN